LGWWNIRFPEIQSQDKTYSLDFVIPAKAGIQSRVAPFINQGLTALGWIPAFAGMTGWFKWRIVAVMKIPKTLKKTLSYAVMHMVLAILVAFALSGSWQVALAIGLVEPCVQTVAFFFHEKVWHRIDGEKPGQDHHDSVIDSVSPVTRWIEWMLRHKH
jgi:uncharacterized membrane protein